MPLHPQLAALRADRAAQGTAPRYELSLAQARAADLAAIRAGAGAGERVHHVAKEVFAGPGGDLTVRVYRPDALADRPVLLYFFGGGWALGSLETGDAVCRSLANAAGCVTIAVGYRLAPENPFPAAVHDCFAALCWAADNAARFGGDPARLAVAGDSAGGSLAAATALLARDRGGPDVRHQVLVYPNTDHAADTASARNSADPLLFNRRSVAWYWGHYLSGADGADPLASPAAADLTGLPEATVVTAEYDPVRDEGEQYADRLREAGVPVALRRYDGMAHGFFHHDRSARRGTRGARLDRRPAAHRARRARAGAPAVTAPAALTPPTPPARRVPLTTADLHGSLSDPLLETMTFLNEVTSRHPDAISFAPGRPYEGFFDVASIHTYLDAYLDHLARDRGLPPERVRTEVFQYGRTKGIVHELIARTLAADEDLRVDPEALVVTVGAQEGMLLVLRALFASPLDVLLVSSPCYVGITGAARLLDIPVEFVPEGPGGADVDALAEAAAGWRRSGRRPRAFYVVPDFATPRAPAWPPGPAPPAGRRRRPRPAGHRGRPLRLLRRRPAAPAHPQGPRPRRRRDPPRLLRQDLFPRRPPRLRRRRPARPAPGRPPEPARGRTGQAQEHDDGEHPVPQPGGHRRHADPPRLPAARGQRTLPALLRPQHGHPARLPRPGSSPAPDRSALGIGWNAPEGGFFAVVTVPFTADDAALERCARKWGVLWTPMAGFHPAGGGTDALRLSCSCLEPQDIAEGVRRLAGFLREAV